MKLVEINMSAKKNSSIHDRLLTEVELELMNIIWSLNKVTIKEVVAHLPKERPLAYTTVATVIKVLEQKGFLECQKNSFAHVFTPMVTKSEYESTCIDHMVANVFDGEPRALIQRLLMARKLQHDDIQAIEEALKKLTDGEKQAEVL
ncbi:TPA: BlaI/MecI/CopY family transcriptional regulator [Legionella pneumophila]|nr:BlaI/MecI/CopY family transcriptional regulator [Legionella pneumophila]HAT7770468.1 BlaI/MecI/CopY family transcriptional regulator [Legionella pneumophila]HAU1684184.1 BlaI/MecI/CopY family transcriptional regulator [Legionella pneumophila]HAU1685320.1 BlaI/MecI/CopY family transcriptional regulator [Legionella pneumophila]HAU1717554.1 BlaI/MecI/CopY family transcriptional regulator [Legionella pneumophila]